MLSLLRFLPTALLSRIFGWTARLPLPRFLLDRIIQWYIKAFNVNTDEMITPEKGFRTLEDFFTRRLRDGARAIDSEMDTVVSPVDGRVDQFGDIADDLLMQAKGISYHLEDLVPSTEAAYYRQGSFITIYLSPGDYHRMHSPVDGFITVWHAIPGRLLSVQKSVVKKTQGLFTLNERVISHISTEEGMAAVVKVGAMNVGRISLSYADIISNRCCRRNHHHYYHPEKRPTIKRGDEIGIFHLGSTVILLFEKKVNFSPLQIGDITRVGAPLGRFRKNT